MVPYRYASAALSGSASMTTDRIVQRYAAPGHAIFTAGVALLLELLLSAGTTRGGSVRGAARRRGDVAIVGTMLARTIAWKYVRAHCTMCRDTRARAAVAQ